jgi:transcriptional regulator with XRE-family HTH domain
MTFAEKIKNLRKKNGLTQLELCKAFGVSERTFRGWENENRYPQKSTIYICNWRSCWTVMSPIS